MLQNNLERSEFETKSQLTQQISQLEKENKVLQRRIDTAEGQHRGAMNMMEVKKKSSNGTYICTNFIPDRQVLLQERALVVF